jgi:hypothetical protein
MDLERPAATEVGPAFVEGQPARRLMVILRAPGCTYALRSGGCTNCGFLHLTTRGVPVAPAQLVAQLQSALDEHQHELHQVRQLDLYCSGSFFNDEEIPGEARQALLRLCADVPSLRTVLVDSRPEFVTESVLEATHAALTRPDPLRLEVAVGLESANDEIRLQRIRKGFTLRSFERAAAALARTGARLVVYLLLKPLGTTEEEAVADVLASGSYLSSLAHRLSLSVRVALEPAFVPEGTPLFEELRASRYRPPSLWSVVRATLGLREIGLQVHVGLSTEGLPADNLPAGCPECTAMLREALAAFNETQDGGLLRALRCGCHP